MVEKNKDGPFLSFLFKSLSLCYVIRCIKKWWRKPRFGNENLKIKYFQGLDALQVLRVSGD